MNRWIITLAVSTAVGIATGQTPAQAPRRMPILTPTMPNAGKLNFPPRRSGRQGQRRDEAAPPGAVNPGSPDEATWKYGPPIRIRRPTPRSGIR